MTTTWPQNILLFAKAIEVAEGSNPAWNNPGDLTGMDKGSFQTVGVANDRGVWKFQNREDGFTALYVKIARAFAGRSEEYPLTMTLDQFGMKYSGGDENWVHNAARVLGVPITITIDELRQELEARPASDLENIA